MKILWQIPWIRRSIFLAIILSPIYSFAGTVELTPGLTIAAEYDDNIDFTPNSSDAVDDFAGSARPNVRLKYNAERYKLVGQAEVDFKKYLNDTEFDRTNQLYLIETSYQAHQRWTLSGNYSFRRDETTDLQFEETGRSFDRNRSQRHDVSAGVTFALTELSDIASVVSYRRVDYSGNENTDHDLYSIELPYTKRFQNQRDTISLTPAYINYKSDDNEEGHDYRFAFGWVRLISETLTFDISVGPRYTTTKENTGEKSSRFGGVGNIGLTQQKETYTAQIRFSHDLRSTQEGEIINVDRLFTSIDKLLTERFGFRFKGNAYYSNTENNNRPNDKIFSFDLTPSLYYLLTENHSVEMSYSYRNQHELDEPGNPTRQRNVVILSFNFMFPQHWD